MTIKITLGIESSCDETAAAVLHNGDVLSSVIFDQTALHADFGGVVPEIAARAHAERLDLVTQQALKDAQLALTDIELIAVTSGPGLIGGVMSGVMFAKGLAAGMGQPIIGVNHLAGHALTPRMTDQVGYPYVMLLVSGGHCQFLAVLGPEKFQRLGGTIDDAPGEAFDKSARLMALGYPGGPLVEKAASSGDPKRFAFPRPLLDRPGCDMSFSGLKTALRRTRDAIVAEKGGISIQDRADLCASFQAAVADVLAEKSRRAIVLFQESTGKATAFCVAGGVAANTVLRDALTGVSNDANLPFIAPPLKYCTDNAAMIAYAGWEQYLAGHRDETITARPRWPLDSAATPMLGSGRKGAKA